MICWLSCIPCDWRPHRADVSASRPTSARSQSACSRGARLLIASEGERTLPDDDLEVVLLGLPVPHIAPVDAHRDRPIRDGKIAPIARAPGDETPLFLAQLCFTAFGDLQGIVAHGLDVERDIEGQKIREGIHRHAV